MAIAIMFYHLTYWHISPLDSSHFLGRLGIYGVSVFFVLSGLSMAIVYSSFIVDRKTAKNFYIRRIFRIWPLLWICVTLVTIPLLLKGNEVSVIRILINLTTLFGFVSPGSYINTGAWSIGNEMVYYALTPPLLISYERSRINGNGLLVLSLIAALLFAFVLLDPQRPLADQWQTYINPFNNIFLYVAGIAIYYNLRNVKMTLTAVMLLFSASIAVFIFYPVTGNQIAITTGVNRVIFLLASISLVCAFYKFPQNYLIPRSIQYPLEQFGIATYGIYLLHPIVNTYANYALTRIGLQEPAVIFAVVVVLTPALAIVSFNRFEKKFMTYGKTITANGSNLWIMLNRVRPIIRSSGGSKEHR
jgi:exopolysaccharide production protein ExoZ